MNSVLFQPFHLHDLTLPNRIVLSPMTRARAGAARLPNRLMAEYYAQRSSAGLLITEATTISEEANGWNESPGIYTDEMTEGWKHTTNAVHEKGGVIFLQLWHTGRASHSSFHGGKPAVAPSAIKINEPDIHTPTGKQPHEVPRALETSEIPRVVADYRRAAERAKQAGFDGVELHAANGYLIDQFLQSKTNRRTDEYGGSVENRYRFLKEVIAAVRPDGRVDGATARSRDADIRNAQIVVEEPGPFLNEQSSQRIEYRWPLPTGLRPTGLRRVVEPLLSRVRDHARQFVNGVAGVVFRKRCLD